MLQTFVSVGSKEKLDAGITSSVNTVIGFATPYIQNITGYGDNHIVGFALNVDLSSERQIAFGVISKKWYVRSMSFSSGTWTAWEQI